MVKFVYIVFISPKHSTESTIDSVWSNRALVNEYIELMKFGDPSMDYWVRLQQVFTEI